MSEEKNIGFKCKNKKCGANIVQGTHLTRPKKKGDLITFTKVKEGKLTCPKCGETHVYNQGDLREFA